MLTTLNRKSQRASRLTTSLQLSASFYDFSNRDKKPNCTKHLCHTFCFNSTQHLHFSSSFLVFLETLVPPGSRNDSTGGAPQQDRQCRHSRLPSSHFLIAKLSDQLSQNPVILTLPQRYTLIHLNYILILQLLTYEVQIYVNTKYHHT